MLAHNKQMQDFLRQNGIEAVPKRIDKGSLKGTWRLYNFKIDWSLDLASRLNGLGFTDFDGKPISQISGNGGRFSVFVRKRLN